MSAIVFNALEFELTHNSFLGNELDGYLRQVALLQARCERCRLLPGNRPNVWTIVFEWPDLNSMTEHLQSEELEHLVGAIARRSLRMSFTTSTAPPEVNSALKTITRRAI